MNARAEVITDFKDLAEYVFPASEGFNFEGRCVAIEVVSRPQSGTEEEANGEERPEFVELLIEVHPYGALAIDPPGPEAKKAELAANAGGRAALQECDAAGLGGVSDEERRMFQGEAETYGSEQLSGVELTLFVDLGDRQGYERERAVTDERGYAAIQDVPRQATCSFSVNDGGPALVAVAQKGSETELQTYGAAGARPQETPFGTGADKLVGLPARKSQEQLLQYERNENIEVYVVHNKNGDVLNVEVPAGRFLGTHVEFELGSVREELELQRLLMPDSWHGSYKLPPTNAARVSAPRIAFPGKPTKTWLVDKKASAEHLARDISGLDLVCLIGGGACSTALPYEGLLEWVRRIGGASSPPPAIIVVEKDLDNEQLQQLKDKKAQVFDIAPGATNDESATAFGRPAWRAYQEGRAAPGVTIQKDPVEIPFYGRFPLNENEESLRRRIHRARTDDPDNLV